MDERNIEMCYWKSQKLAERGAGTDVEVIEAHGVSFNWSFNPKLMNLNCRALNEELLGSCL